MENNETKDNQNIDKEKIIKDDIKKEEQKDSSNILLSVLENEMKESYLDYSMSVIVGRALPDIRDGLKPVHRRILYAMKEMGLLHNKPFRKCARIVGDVLGKYHPHGDSAVYDALVRMAQDFSMRYRLIEGHGNFGSIDGDSPAAMRYTEARLTKFAELMLNDLDKNTVDFQDNFDASLKEPVVLPSLLPNLLLNGSSGIAVGMATKIPPHNLKEVIDALVFFIENIKQSKDVSVDDLIKFIKGPDFPTRGIVKGKDGLLSAYKYGKGKILIESKLEYDENKNRIIITELPYQVNKSDLIKSIVDLVNKERIKGIKDIRDESNRLGIRIIIELKKDANYQLIKNQLFKFSNLAVDYTIVFLGLLNNIPKIFNLKELLKHFIDFRIEILVRKSKFMLKKYEKEKHIIEGLIKALQFIDDVIKLIKSSDSVKKAIEGLMNNFDLTEIQSKAILDMKLQRLTKLEQEKLNNQYRELQRKIAELKDLLNNKNKQYDLIKENLINIKKEFGDQRKTEILDVNLNNFNINYEDLIENERKVIILTENDYIKLVDLDEYKLQHRGGKGVIASKDQAIKLTEVTYTHNYILFFTNTGRVFWKKAYEIPNQSRYAKGTYIANLLDLNKDEKIKSILSIDKFDNRSVIFITKKGIVKKTSLMNFSHPRRNGIIATNLIKDDEIIDVKLIKQGKIAIASKKGYCVVFDVSELRDLQRNSIGVRGIKLKDDEVVSADVFDISNDNENNKKKTQLLTITEKGYGKRSELSNYRETHRNSKGVKNIKNIEKTGFVISIKAIDENDELLITSLKGNVIRIYAKDVSLLNRNTQGVRVMKLNNNDKVINVSIIPN